MSAEDIRLSIYLRATWDYRAGSGRPERALRYIASSVRTASRTMPGTYAKQRFPAVTDVTELAADAALALSPIAQAQRHLRLTEAADGGKRIAPFHEHAVVKAIDTKFRTRSVQPPDARRQSSGALLRGSKSTPGLGKPV